jgi:hypothetical protein
MRRVFLIVFLAVLGASGLAAQATGMPLYNAPYRAFQRSEIGAAVSFPSSAGTAFLGMYRMASGNLDLGFQAGIWDPCSGCKSVFLAGVEARDRVITHNADFPLDGAVVVGLGGEFVSGANVLVIPAGLTLGRRVQLQGNRRCSFLPATRRGRNSGSGWAPISASRRALTAGSARD